MTEQPIGHHGTDDLLIEEFHEAGLWLPEEIEARQWRLEKRRA